MRARGFALRDAFPDALKGSMSVEEVNDTPPQETPPHTEAEKVVNIGDVGSSAKEIVKSVKEADKPSNDAEH